MALNLLSTLSKLFQFKYLRKYLYDKIPLLVVFSCTLRPLFAIMRLIGSTIVFYSTLKTFPVKFLSAK